MTFSTVRFLAFMTFHDPRHDGVLGILLLLYMYSSPVLLHNSQLCFYSFIDWHCSTVLCDFFEERPVYPSVYMGLSYSKR